MKCICVTTSARTATTAARKSSRRKTTNRPALRSVGLSWDIPAGFNALAFRMAIGSLDIFPVHRKGGIQLPLFCA
ncbi:hypothetical protein BN2476_170030 [Paraburkholderia piptadeniae]|uniref:Uncharacterized protein n=1 Tax=Paraburkholderia piptadeniae TaxID=1701573 RepID=A0A1N7RU34_9BURK|nr:hypothetical protein BN2476_170030 [Paraburkholderia piptadeniae]